MPIYTVYALVIILAVLAASIWLAWYLDRKKAHRP
jgi:heme/copper-type cytochrome/quinol oxidase subunit 4